MRVRIDVERQLASKRAGGDLWNPSTIALRARERGAAAVEYQGIASGLYLDCTLVMQDGRRLENQTLYS
jgi:hypothetical protein